MKQPLIIYTGGTIGMKPTPHGYAPDDTLPSTLKNHSYFHQRDFELISLLPLIDSAAMNLLHWQTMINAITRYADPQRHSGVIILHGTDTLAHTAAMLSFCLATFPIPIIITGAMRSIHDHSASHPSDGWANLQTSVETIASLTKQSGVYVGFAGKYMHGARVTKFDGSRDDAFQTPNGDRPYAITPAYQALLSKALQPLRVAQYSCSPYMTDTDFDGIQATNLDALLIGAYGSGTVPPLPNFFRQLSVATNAGLLAVAITQCPVGSVNIGTYAASQALIEAGCLSAGDMTREACLAKLFYLQQLPISIADKRRLFITDLVGERA